MRARLCVGEYTTTPYCIPGLEIPVYCVEELCYCLKENAFLLDISLMNDSLLKWLEDCCGLGELSGELYPLVHKRGSLSAFVSMIMEYTALYDTAAIRETERVLKQGAGLSGIERRKSQIDYLVKKRKYVSALRGYDALLYKWTELESEGKELPAARVRAAIFHNKGVAFAGLMMYGQAAEMFMLAYRTYNNEEHFMAFLAAKRMELSDGDYIAFVAELTDSYDKTLALEKQLEVLRGEWQLQAEAQLLRMHKDLRSVGDKQQYYDENEKYTVRLKNSYRNNVSE